MIIIVHRGTKQIGGSCVEVQSGDDSVLLDLGLPLPSPDDEPVPPDLTVDALLASGVLPDIEGLYADSNPRVLAVITSHAHQDHLGLAQHVHPSIPVYATEGTWALHDALRVFIPKSKTVSTRRVLPRREKLHFGSLTVTAIPVDHSAPDAVALLVEAGGKRLLYSGDFRAHGRKSYLYDRLIRELARSIDVLLLEGTTIGRPEAEIATEASLESDLLAILEQQRHLALVFCSAQNLEQGFEMFIHSIQMSITYVSDNRHGILLRSSNQCNQPNIQFLDTTSIARRCSAHLGLSRVHLSHLSEGQIAALVPDWNQIGTSLGPPTRLAALPYTHRNDVGQLSVPSSSGG